MTSRCLANTRSKPGTKVGILRHIAIICVTTCAFAATPACVLPSIEPGGDLVVTRFMAAPMPRAHEVMADAMQAAGVALFKNMDQSMEGERTEERIEVLGLPRGDEAVRAELTPLTQDGKAGTQVRVETLRSNHKKGTPKHAWSATVLDQAECLISLLRLDDPSRRPKIQIPSTDSVEIQVTDATSVPVLSRHFLFNTDLKPNQLVSFETAEDVVINGTTVIPSGSLVMASMEAKDIGEYGRGAKGQLQFKFLTLPDGTRLTLRGNVDLQGKKVGKAALIVGTVAFGTGVLSVTGSGFAIPAGTLFNAEVDGKQKIRASASKRGRD